MYNLIIIDMQDDFINHLHPFYAQDIIEAINDYIEVASKDDANIIFLEFLNEEGDKNIIYTTNKINTNVKNSNFIKKYEMDGSEAIKNFLNFQKNKFENFKICGIFAKHCVLSTVNGLSRNFPDSKIEVMKYGIDSANLDLFIDNPIDLMLKNKNVIINDKFENKIKFNCFINESIKKPVVTRKYKWKKK